MIRVDERRTACLGECMIELVERPDGSLTRGFGGDTLNTAVYLARLGVAVDYVTALGDDPFSAEMLRAWAREKIGIGHVFRVPGRLPGLYLIQTAPDGERRFSYWRDGAPVRGLFALPGADAIRTALAGMSLVYLSGITLSLFDDAGRAALFDNLAEVARNGGRIAFDYNFRPRGWPEIAVARTIYERMLSLCDVVFASVEDYTLLFDLNTAADAVAHLTRAEIAEFVVKLPQPGCVVVAGPEINAFVPADFVGRVVDTTAAGDSFAAAYLAARCSGATPEQAARAGHRLAAIVIGHRGALVPPAAMPALDGVRF